MFKCKYCGKEFSSERSVNYHEKNGCKENIDSRKNLKPYIAKNGDLLNVSNGYIKKYKSDITSCEICGLPITSMKSGNCLCVDHDHTSKKFRGLLCIRCNLSLAWYEQNRKTISEYLSRNMDL